MTRPAIVSGTFVDLSDPATLEHFGIAGELLVRELRRNGRDLPDTMAGATVKAVIAMYRAQRTPGACAPARGSDLHGLRSVGHAPASGAKTSSVWLTTRDVHERLEVSRQRVRQLADSGELPGEKDGLDRWRFLETDVETYETKRLGRNPRCLTQ